MGEDDFLLKTVDVFVKSVLVPKFLCHNFTMNSVHCPSDCIKKINNYGTEACV